MKRKFYFTLIIALFTATAFSQTGFQRLIGGPLHERAQTVLNTHDGNYLINAATGSYGAGGYDVMLIKLDVNGQIIWSNTYGTTEYDNSEYAIETNNHDFVCVGRSNLTTGAPTAAIMFRTDSAGNVIWSKTYGGTANDGFVNVIETSDHGFAAVGNSASLSSGSNDILLVRTDANGDTLFTHSYGSAENEAGVCVIQLPDNGFVICGRQTTNNGTKGDGILLRTDSLGNQLWAKMYGDSLFEELTSVKQTADGGFALVGSTTGYGAGGFDILLMKTDSGGALQWSKTFGGAVSDAAYDIHITSGNGFIISGFTESLGYGHKMAGSNETNIYLLKTDSAGTLQWMEVYGDGLQDEAFHSDIAADGGFLVGGFTTNYLLNDSSQMLIIKTDSMGLSGCHEVSALPLDTMVALLNHDTLFTQLSGLPVGNFTLITAVVTTNNDDACLFSGNTQIVESNQVSAYPNPFSGELNINIGDANAKADVIIYDALGKVQIRKMNVKEKISINTSNLNSGIYYVSISNDTSKKIIPVVLAK